MFIARTDALILDLSEDAEIKILEEAIEREDARKENGRVERSCCCLEVLMRNRKNILLLGQLEGEEEETFNAKVENNVVSEKAGNVGK